MAKMTERQQADKRGTVSDPGTKEVIRARGHPNVTGTHGSTFEVTRDDDISSAADCIIAVGADKGAASLSADFKKAAASDDAFITCTIEAGGFRDTVTGWGSKEMTFTVEDSMVFRVSNYVCADRHGLRGQARRSTGEKPY